MPLRQQRKLFCKWGHGPNPIRRSNGACLQCALVPKEENWFNPENRFRKFTVPIESGCWEWRGMVESHGYGSIRLGKGKRMRAHRYSWSLYNGPIPKGLFVLHSCDYPRCVNPAHLRLGTQKENMQDRLRRNRFDWSKSIAAMTKANIKRGRYAKA